MVRQRLESLVERTDAESLAEVIRRALAVYDLLHGEIERGGKVFVRHADGTEESVLFTG